MPLSLINTIGHDIDDMIPFEVIMLDFIRGLKDTIVVLQIDPTIKSNTSNTTFFIIEAKTSYYILCHNPFLGYSPNSLPFLPKQK
jgi:hypothetical protein